MNKDINSNCYRVFPGATGPTGPTGATGPTGPTGSSGSNPNIFGYKYNDEGNTKTLTANITMPIDLSINGKANGISVTLENSMIINTPGIYKMEYFFAGSISDSTALVIELRNNNIPINGSEISKDLLANTEADFHATTIVEASQNDVINIAARANKNVVLTPAPDVNAYLIITKIA